LDQEFQHSSTIQIKCSQGYTPTTKTNNYWIDPMPLTPIVESLLKTMADAGGPSISDVAPQQGREMYRMMHQDMKKAELHEVVDQQAGSVPIRIYRPSEGDNKPCLVFFHGGGWVIGDLDTHDAPCRMLAKSSDCVVIAVDYRLAPEHPFPKPFDDCYEAFSWIHQHAQELGINPLKLAVGGDSAGGNLAAALCLKIKAESGPTIRHQLLIYPVTDAAMDTASYSDNAEGYMLTRATMAWFFDHYIGPEHRQNPLVSPLLAEDLSGLPPATVFTAEFDPLRDEGEAYGKRLEEAGVQTLVKRFDGQVHGFFTMTDVMPEAQQAADLAAKQLIESFD
jgi:acetyl esterase